MQITVTVPDEFAREAAARGLSVEEYALRAIREHSKGPQPATEAEAGEDLRTFGQRHGLTLGPDLKIRDLIREGRRR